jgi:hypothetical protein
MINSTLLALIGRTNKDARLYDNQTPVVSNSRISGRNEKAGANPVKIVFLKDQFL